MHVLLTGATGFIGQHLARNLVARGDRVTALVRHTSVTGPLEAVGVRLTRGDLVTAEGLPEALRGVDVVIHLAGVTKALDEVDFQRGNAQATRRLVEAMARLERPARLVLCSSLAAAGPSRAGQPRRETDAPAPVSAYGRSKLGAEQAVRDFAARIPSVIVRPPIVYGPGDREFLPSLLPMLRWGVALKSGQGPKHYSLIHVDDLCAALVAAAERGATVSAEDAAAGVYFVSDGREYTWEEVCEALARALGRARARVVALPDAVGHVVGLGMELQARLRGTVPMLNRDKARDMACEAWTCTPERARDALGFMPGTAIEQGFPATLAWYRQQGWL
jgi:dihydroflavonol-4-reductase